MAATRAVSREGLAVVGAHVEEGFEAVAECGLVAVVEGATGCAQRCARLHATGNAQRATEEAHNAASRGAVNCASARVLEASHRAGRDVDGVEGKPLEGPLVVVLRYLRPLQVGGFRQ